MKHPGDKGTFTADIADSVVKEALDAVERRTAPADEGAARELTSLRKENETLKAELEISTATGRDLMAKLKDEHEKMLRATADLENYKRRAQKEKEEVQRYGIEKLLKDFLPVFDNFDRALDAAKTDADFASLRKGVEMIRKLFEDTLSRHGVKTFEAKNQPFDPNRHEAISAAETTELPPNHVFNEVLRGFTLNERLIRPALVVVSRAPASPEQTPPESKPTEGGGDSGGSQQN